jgi:hypothetical protein
MFPIRNGLKQGDTLLPLTFNLALEYAIKRVQANQVGLKLNSTHQLLVYTDDVNILGGSIHTVKKNTAALVVASKETGLEVNVRGLSQKNPAIFNISRTGSVALMKLGSQSEETFLRIREQSLSRADSQSLVGRC